MTGSLERRVSKIIVLTDEIAVIDDRMFDFKFRAASVPREIWASRVPTITSAFIALEVRSDDDLDD